MGNARRARKALMTREGIQDTLALPILGTRVGVPTVDRSVCCYERWVISQRLVWGVRVDSRRAQGVHLKAPTLHILGTAAC